MNAYDRIARLYPAYITLLPFSVLLVAAFANEDWWKLTLGVVAGAGVPYFLTDLVRKYGKAAEIELFEMWGGPPTTELLRRSTNNLKTEHNPTLREARRSAVSRHSGVDLPSPDDELADPDAADRQYLAAMRPLRKKFIDDPQVARELRHYGLWRNLYGLRNLMRWAGAAAASVAILLVVLAATLDLGVSTPLLYADIGVGALVFFVGWRVLTPDAVHGPAREYAEQLMQAACVP
ncbi:MAG: hypothetical protein JWQ32_2208 [Marmoricola sp.]|nr:hypothetical protein [Marmoricola sp.]